MGLPIPQLSDASLELLLRVPGIGVPAAGFRGHEFLYIAKYGADELSDTDGADCEVFERGGEDYREGYVG